MGRLAAVVAAIAYVAWGLPANAQDAVHADLVELWRVGDSEDDEVLFSSLVRTGVDSEGRVYVTDWGQPVVYVFSTAGTLLHEIGRAGSGPGEFEHPRGVHLGDEDTLFVWDEGRDHLTVFSPRDYSYVRTIRPAKETTGSAFEFIGVVPDGLLFSYNTVYYQDETEGLTLESPRFDRIRRVARTGAWIGEPLDIMPTLQMAIIRSGGGASVSQMPFGRTPWAAVSKEGLLYSAYSDSVAIRIQSSNGQFQRRVTWPHESIPVTEDDLNHAFRRNSRRFRRAVMKIGVPETKPAFQHFVVDDQDRLWVQLSAPYGATKSQHVILSGDGIELARKELPVQLQLQVIRHDRAVGVWQEDDGPPYVVTYTIR